MSMLRRWQRALGNGYRNWRFGTRDRPANRLGVILAHLSPWYRAAMDGDFRHLPRAGKGSRLLDIGCGNGAFLARAASAGWEVVGVDPDETALAAARRQGLNVHEGTADSIPAAPSSFDVVTLSHVIEHVYDPRGLIGRIYMLLKPGGLLWLETPNMSSLGHRRFGSAWPGLDPPRHLVLFGYGTLRQLLESAGFRSPRRISRFEMTRGFFATSERIRNGNRSPLRDGPVSLALRLQSLAASWRVRLDADRSEVIALLARKPGP